MNDCFFAFDAAGNLLFIANGAGEIRLLNRKTGTASTVATGVPGFDMRGITYQDSIFVGDGLSNLYKIDPGTGSSTLLVNIGGAGYINCLAVAPATYGSYGGQLIAATSSGGIYAIDQSEASPLRH